MSEVYRFPEFKHYLFQIEIRVENKGEGGVGERTGEAEAKKEGIEESD